MDVLKVVATAGVYHTPIPEIIPFSRAPKKPSTSPSNENGLPPSPPHGPKVRLVLSVNPRLVMLSPVALPETRITCTSLPVVRGTAPSGLPGNPLLEPCSFWTPPLKVTCRQEQHVLQCRTHLETMIRPNDDTRLDRRTK
jgi:hypothetical protein